MATRIVSRLLAVVLGAALALPGAVLADRFPLFGSSTGILKGSATSFQTTPATSADVIALWSGTCNSGTILDGAGACVSPGSGGLGTVTSVQGVGTGIFSFTGGPITTAGSLTLVQTGTSGGIPYFSAGGTLSSSAALTANRIVLGGGAGVTPASLGSLGTTTTVLHGNAAGAPTFGAVSLTADVSGTLPVANGGTNLTAAADDNAMVGNGTTWETKALTSCSAATSAVTYNTTTNAFGCNTIASGSPAGSTGQLQYNNASAFAATTGVQWSATAISSAFPGLVIGTGAVAGGLAGAAGAEVQVVAGSNSSGAGKQLSLSGGDASGAGNSGGQVEVSAGHPANGDGGRVYLRGAAGVGTSRAGGSVLLESAAGAGGGNAGDIIATTGGSGGLARITLTGSQSASTGVRFNGYGAGSLSTDSSGNVTSSSDARMKRDIREFDRGLEVVMNLHPVQFGWAPETGLDQTKDDYTGFTAQDVEAVLPEAVGYDGNGMRSVADRAIIAALVNAIKQQDARIRELESRQ